MMQKINCRQIKSLINNYALLMPAIFEHSSIETSPEPKGYFLRWNFDIKLINGARTLQTQKEPCKTVLIHKKEKSFIDTTLHLANILLKRHLQNLSKSAVKINEKELWLKICDIFTAAE